MHPGGPYWRRKDEGAWSIPKGEMDAGEDAGDVARREFMEELGRAPVGLLHPLGEIRQRGGKRVHAFAVNGDLDVQTIASNTFEIEWPPKSGRLQTFPQVDRAEWFTLPIARTKSSRASAPYSIGWKNLRQRIEITRRHRAGSSPRHRRSAPEASGIGASTPPRRFVRLLASRTGFSIGHRLRSRNRKSAIRNGLVAFAVDSDGMPRGSRVRFLNGESVGQDKHPFRGQPGGGQ